MMKFECKICGTIFDEFDTTCPACGHEEPLVSYQAFEYGKQIQVPSTFPQPSAWHRHLPWYGVGALIFSVIFTFFCIGFHQETPNPQEISDPQVPEELEISTSTVEMPEEKEHSKP